MKWLCLFNVIIWAFIGAMDLSGQEIKKGSYSLIWILFMLSLIIDCVEAF